jgi:hypothetical protein
LSTCRTNRTHRTLRTSRTNGPRRTSRANCTRQTLRASRTLGARRTRGAREPNVALQTHRTRDADWALRPRRASEANSTFGAGGTNRSHFALRTKKFREGRRIDLNLVLLALDGAHDELPRFPNLAVLAQHVRRRGLDSRHGKAGVSRQCDKQCRTANHEFMFHIYLNHVIQSLGNPYCELQTASHLNLGPCADGARCHADTAGRASPAE